MGPGVSSGPVFRPRVVADGGARTLGVGGDCGFPGIFKPCKGLFNVDIGKKKIRVINAVLFLYSGKFYC